MMLQDSSLSKFPLQSAFEEQRGKALLISDDPYFYNEVSLMLSRAGLKTTWLCSEEELSTISRYTDSSFVIVDGAFPTRLATLERYLAKIRVVPVIFVAATARVQKFLQLSYKGFNPALFFERKAGAARIIDGAFDISGRRQANANLRTQTPRIRKVTADGIMNGWDSPARILSE